MERLKEGVVHTVNKELASSCNSYTLIFQVQSAVVVTHKRGQYNGSSHGDCLKGHLISPDSHASQQQLVIKFFLYLAM